MESTIYDKLVDEKHHYDNLTWIVGAPILAIAAGILVYMTELTGASNKESVLLRMVGFVFICALTWIWLKIYNRNRVFAEAANEAIRDIERKHNVRGSGIAFMEAALTLRVDFKNTNEESEEVKPLDSKGNPRKVIGYETMKEDSIHFSIPAVVWWVRALALVVAIAPVIGERTVESPSTHLEVVTGDSIGFRLVSGALVRPGQIAGTLMVHIDGEWHDVVLPSSGAQQANGVR